MYYSYVMGMDASICALQEQGFQMQKDGADNYMISFAPEKAKEW